MNAQMFSRLVCTTCACPLVLLEAFYCGDDVSSGTLQCTSCRCNFPIRDFVPRFVASENYTSNFGWQWIRFRRTQLDSHSGTTISRDRFLRSTSWTPAQLEGALVLDAGCGAGRFTEVALSLGARGGLKRRNTIRLTWPLWEQRKVKPCL